MKLTKVERLQREVRGFSDRDAWNGDSYLLFIISGLLKHYVRTKSGACGRYLKEGERWDTVSLKAVRKRRDKDYLRTAKKIDKFLKSGAWHSPALAEEFGGLTEDEYKATLDWIRDHFEEFWD